MTSSLYNNSDRQRVLEATDIVQIIGEHIILKPAGRNFKGLCPFHDDNHPSLTVTPDKNIFKCFACGAGGSTFDFVMKYHNMDFREALEYLAQRAGIELTSNKNNFNTYNQSSKSGTQHNNTASNTDGYYEDPDYFDSYNQQQQPSTGPQVSSADILNAHTTALQFYQAILRNNEHGKIARTIFAQRAISEQMISDFQLGAAPDRWDGLVQTLQSKNISLTPFIHSGLIIPKRDGNGYVDRFRNRLIFPIQNAIGQTIAFGARIINPEDEPKYLNSPEHEKFNKSRTLYGLYLARNSIQKTDTAIVVEGYTDVIACRQAGFTNVVAAMGTALTIEHARILQRHCNNVILVFDGDQAGRKAADRSVEIFFKTNIDIRFAILPENTDPADILKANTQTDKDKFQTIINSSIDILTYLLQTLRQNLESQSIQGISQKQSLIELFTNRLGTLGFHNMLPLRRDLILAQISNIINMPVSTILSSIPKPRTTLPIAQSAANLKPAQPDKNPVSSTRTSTDRQNKTRNDTENGLLGLLIHSPELLDLYIEEAGKVISFIIQPEWFKNKQNQYIYKVLADTQPDIRSFNKLLADIAGNSALSQLVVDLQCQAADIVSDERNKITDFLFAYLKVLQDLHLDELICNTNSQTLNDDHRHNPHSTPTITPAAKNKILNATDEDNGNIEIMKTRIENIRARGGSPRKLGKKSVPGSSEKKTYKLTPKNQICPSNPLIDNPSSSSQNAEANHSA